MDAVALIGPWQSVSGFLRRASAEVTSEIKLATIQNAVGMVGALKTGLTSGTLLDGSKLKELHPFTVLRRLATVPASQRDRALARMAGGNGAKPLFNHGDLARSFTYKLSPDGWSAAVGVNRQAVSQDGKSMVNIASVMFNGRSILVTDKMRGWLGANGMHLKKSTTHIVIPPRNPVPPTFNAYKPVMIQRYKDALRAAFGRLAGKGE